MSVSYRPHRARNYQAKQKLARAYGIVNILILHRIADFAAQADDGTTAAKIGAGLLADTQTRVMFHQDADQIGSSRAALDLTETEAALLPQLKQGWSLWKVGAHSGIVHVRIADREWPIAQSDDRMLT